MNYSDWTDTKNEVVRGIFTWLLTSSRSVMERYPHTYPDYRYFDMNAADGSGSPRFFIDAACRLGVPYRALFIEQNRTQHAALLAAHSRNQFVDIRHGDHTTILPLACQQLVKKPYGLIYNDPCGIPSFETLADVSGLPAIEHIDILINCPATAIKRARNAFKRTTYYLIEELDKIQKKRWLVRAPPKGGTFARWQWTVLLGTNWDDVQNWRAQQVYRVDSPEGQEVLRRLNLTNEEREREDAQTLPFL